jgi:hypothetical protein
MRPTLRRWLRRLLVVPIGVLALFWLTYCGTFGYYGVGHFWQEVVLDSDRPIVKASYATVHGHLSEEERRQLEAAPDLEMRLVLDTATLEGNRFEAYVMWTSGPGLFDRPKYQADLVVVVEFADGTRACRIVDIPKGMGKEPISVPFR